MIATDYKAPKCLLEGLPIREATTQGYAIAREGDAVNIAFPSSKTRRGRVGEQMANTLEASGCNQGVVEREDSPLMLGHIDLKGHDAIKRVYSPDAQAPTLTTMGGGHREPKIAEDGPQYRIRKLSPRECMRLQGFPESATDLLYTNGFSDSRVYKFARQCRDDYRNQGAC